MGQQFVDSILSSNAGGSAVFEKAIDTKAQQLSAQNLRYYMYDEPEITLKGWIFKRHPDNFIFYQSRREGSWFNATIYRHAPITNITNSTGLFPKSSIGFGLESEDWFRQYRDSKFCLVVRGDNPMTHSHWRAIRNGCIPVIASDSLPIYSPLFKSTMNVLDYAIFVGESELVENPEGALLKLTTMSVTDIETKIRHLDFAQRVIFTDHPNSLFVPAFLREATKATEVKL